MLHTQELATARAQKKQGSYRLATPADTGVATLWRWLDLVGGIPYADGRWAFWHLHESPHSAFSVLVMPGGHSGMCMKRQRWRLMRELPKE